MTRRLVSLTIMFLLLGGAVLAQSKPSPLSDYQYKKDLEKYNTILKEPDVQKRADQWLAFLKERQINRVTLYMVQDYQGAIAAQLQKKDWTKAISMAETMLAALPTTQVIKQKEKDEEIPVGADDYIKQQLQPSRQKMQETILAAYYESANWPKAAEAQEKLNASAPSAQGLARLADIYLKMQNYDKYLDTIKKILAQNPANTQTGLSALAQGVKVALENKSDVAAAVNLFSQYSGKVDAKTKAALTMQLFGSTVDKNGDNTPAGVDAAKWNPIRTTVYYNNAGALYSKKDFAGAMVLFEKLVRVDPKNADGWYYIGMCKWQTKDQKGAIEPLAKSVTLGKASARQHLEQLYKAENKDSLEGLDAVLAKAKTDLGM